MVLIGFFWSFKTKGISLLTRRWIITNSNLVPQVGKVDINAIQLSGKVCEKVYAFLGVISQYTIPLKSTVNQDEIKKCQTNHVQLQIQLTFNITAVKKLQ